MEGPINIGSTREVSDMQRILNMFDNELGRLEKNVSIIFEKVCALKDVRQPTPVETKNDIQAGSSGIIETINFKLQDLGNFNNKLDTVRESLIKIVG